MFRFLPLLAAMFLSTPAGAGDLTLEKDLRASLIESRAVIRALQAGLASGGTVSGEITRLRALADDIAVSHLLLQERFTVREDRAESLGSKARDRQHEVSEGFNRALKEYLNLIESIPADPQPATSNAELATRNSQQLLDLLDKLLPKRKYPIIGSLPYNHLRYPSREPGTATTIIPAYKGGNKTVTVDDTKSTALAPKSKEIAALAQSLNWNPVSIYEWVKNNIETEWYWGCMKGAEETLRQKSGNDCDQATVLTALLRAADFPTRYVRGTIEFFPGIEQVKNLTGIDDPARIAEFFQKAGIPSRPIIRGGGIVNFQIEHIWVESQIPYANYRGAIIDPHGKAWLGLDTSIKVKGYQYNSPLDILPEVSLSNIRDDYLGISAQPATRTPQPGESPLDYVKRYINEELATRNAQLGTYPDLLRTRALNEEVLNILPGSLQFKDITVTHEYTSLPDELIHHVKVTANTEPATRNDLFSITLPLYRLSNQQVIISYEPETVEDQEIINAYGGLDNTPSYLVHLRPVLKINDERVVVGQGGLAMGEDFELTIELRGAGYESTASEPIETITNTMIIGNLTAIGIVAQRATRNTQPETGSAETRNAQQLLHNSAINYIDRWNAAEDELASLLHLTLSRPLPSVVTVGGVVDVTYLLDRPHGFEWKGVFVDADFRTVETVACSGLRVTGSETMPGDRTRLFMQLSVLQGSVLESKLFEDDFQVDSISTAKLFQHATRNPEPATIITIDSSNIDTILPTLPFEDYIKEDMVNAVNQGFELRTPNSELVFQDWTGIGYITENRSSGEAGYLLSGMIAGGMTAWGLDRWPEVLKGILENSYSEPSNYDPDSAQYIQKISATDFQNGTVGQTLADRFQVRVTDVSNRPVAGAEVVFTVVAGGGAFEDGSVTMSAVTNNSGTASARLVLGTDTFKNPTFMQVDEGSHPLFGGPKAQQVGENIVDAALPSGTGITAPFTAYGFPDDDPGQIRIRKTNGDGIWSPIFAFAGFVSLVVEDRYGNPISNIPVEFQVLDPVPNPDLPACSNPNQDTKKAYLVDAGAACIWDAPAWGECGDTTLQNLIVTTHREGAPAHVIAGGTPGAIQQIRAVATIPTASVPVLREVSFYHYTHEFGNCTGTDEPSRQLVFEAYEPTDPYGNNINAGSPGSTVKLQARLFFVAEGETEQDVTLTCGTGTLTCPKIVGTRQYGIRTDFTRSQVTFTSFTSNDPTRVPYAGVADAALPGRYGLDYELKPGVNTIQINGEGSMGIRRSTISCPATCGTVDDEETQQTATLVATVYGVEIQTAPAAYVIVDEQGFAKAASTIPYTILPAEYRAGTATVFFYRDSEVVAYLPSETQGNGTATIGRGFWFDVNSAYEAEVVLNYGTGVEIRSAKVPITVFPDALVSNPFGVERAFHLSQFDAAVPGAIGSSYTDSYQTFTFALEKQATVSVKIFDASLDEKAVLVQEAGLAPGEHRFLADYKVIEDAGINHLASPRFYVLLEVQPADGSAVQASIYPGRLFRRTDGKMLGQTLLHDVLIQDGSLNLSRQDAALTGRGPRLAFSRSYSNQPSARGFTPLGQGWTHSLDLRLRAYSSESSGSGPIPDWVASLKGRFYTHDDVPVTLERWTMVLVNGTMFKRHTGVWYAERGRHGTLTETADAFIYTAKDGTQYRYPYRMGVEMPIQSITDRNGNTMTFSYDTLGRPETVTDAVGRSFTFTYDQVPGWLGLDGSRLTKVTGPDGIELAFAYDALGYLTSAQRGSRLERYAYQRETGLVGGDYNLITATDANNHSFSYTYHGPEEIHANLANFIKVLKSQDVVKSVTYPDNSAASFAYDVQSANKRVVIDHRGNPATYTLNYFGNPTKIEEPEGRTTQMTWSIDEGLSDNVMTSKIDGRGNTTTYGYDGKGNIATETDPYGNAITTTWNQQYSLPEVRTDRNNVTQRWAYDTKGNLEQQEDGDSKTRKYTYTSFGEVETMIDPRGFTTGYTYDSRGNPDTVTGPEGSVTDFFFDVRGRRSAVVDPRGNKTEYTFDDLDQPDQIIHPVLSAYDLPQGSTNIQDFDYDALGNLLKETNRNNLVLTYTYSPRNQVKTVTRSTGGTKSYGYDQNGNLLSETDWKGNAITHTYNNLNQRRSTTNRLGHAMSMAYDVEGNLLQVTDYEGRVTENTYDKLNRLTDTWQPALAGQERGHVQNTYYNEADPKTNLRTVTDQEGNTTTFAYNGRYLVTNRTNALGLDAVREYDDSGNVIKETDEEGKYTQYEYDKQNRRIAVVRMGGIRTEYQYDANGNQTHVTDARNNTTETRYDKWNRAWKVIDAASYATTVGFDGEGNKVSEIDGNSNSRSWQRDTQGRVLSATDAEGNSTSYTYDLNDNVLTTTDARGIVTRASYDAEDRELEITEAFGTADGRTRKVLAYDKMGNALEVKDFNGAITKMAYNALNLPKRVIDPAGKYTETAYYRTGKVKTVLDRRGNITGYAYDALNREIRVTDPKNQIVETTYTNVGKVKTVKDKRGIITENFYDDLHRLTSTVRAGVRLVTNEYDGVDNLTAVIDANNNRTEHAYNSRNLVETTTFADITTQSRIYDGVGNLLTLTDEEGRVTTSTYDKENRRTSVEFAEETTTTAYDEVGNVITVTRPAGTERRNEYDRLNRLTKVIDDPAGLALTTRFEYDAKGNVRHQYDSQGNHVEYTYDSLDRKTRHIQHKSTGALVAQYTKYDAEGNLLEMVDATGRKFTYAYDELNRQIDTTYPDTTAPFYRTTRIHTGYDANNNITTVTEYKTAADSSTLTDVTTNTYDNFDRLDTTTQRGLVVDYGYDDNGNRTSVSTAAGTTDYTYDSRNRLKTAAAGTQVTTYTYYADGKKDTVVYPNGTDVKYTYHPTNRIETITYKVTAAGTVISRYEYEYDANGNRTQQVEEQAGATETTTYTYDNIDRMKDFTVSGAKTTVSEYTFEGYNRKTERVAEDGVVVKSRTYTYDETDWLTKVTDDTDPDNVKTISYLYDKNGNTLRKSDSSLPNGDVTFIYDSRDQLVQTTSGSPGNETVLGLYDYNAQGLRVRHRNSERGDVDYFYDDNAVLEEHNAADGSLLAHYRYADRLLSLETRNPELATRYYHFDALGSTVNLTTDTGTVQVSYNLDPWGHITNQVGTSVNRQIFTGQEHDENTGLIYFGARYYDPDTARFITQDSYLGESGTPPSLNRYLYAYGNPTVFIDLYGYSSLNAWVKTGEGYEHDRQLILGEIQKARDRDMAAGNTAMGFKYSAESTLMGLYGLGLKGVTGALKAADFLIDLGRMNESNENTETGRRTVKRIMVIDEAMKSTAAGLMRFGRKTLEDPTGTYKKVVRVLGDAAVAHGKATFVRGEAKATASTAEILGGIITGEAFVAKAGAIKQTVTSAASVVNRQIKKKIKREAVRQARRSAGAAGSSKVKDFFGGLLRGEIGNWKLELSLNQLNMGIPLNITRKVAKRLPNESGVIREFVQKQNEIYYRVFSGDRRVGSFLTQVPPKSRRFAQEALSLPPHNKAELIQEVVVPAGTRLRRSRAAPMPEWGRKRGGAEQFELLDRIPMTNFGPGRKLP